MSKLELCTKCIGSKEVMESKPSGKGFVYKTCNLCNGKGYVDSELAEDFELSLNEESLEINDE